MTALDRNDLLKRWEPLLEGIGDDHIAYQTARLFENQAKEFTKQSLNEELSPAATTTGKIGTFQKFAFPLIRRTYPELMFNKIGATQAMDGPVSQIFYMGNSRALDSAEQVMYSKFNITPKNLVAGRIGSVSNVDGAPAGTKTFDPADGTSALTFANGLSNVDLSNVIGANSQGAPTSSMGGRIAAFPDKDAILGYSVSAAERLKNQEIPEVNMHIQKQTVQARERKMRALWTLEAAQDLKAYHNLDMEAELTDLLSKEMNLEIDRELIEDIRMIAYGPAALGGGFAGWYLESLYQGNADNFPATGGTGTAAGTAGGAFIGGQYEYDFSTALQNEEAAVGTAAGNGINRRYSNVYIMDLKRFTSTTTPTQGAQHLGHIYSNVLALINFASTDIYRTTLRGAGNVIITSPVIASMLESAAKLEGGLAAADGPTAGATGNQIQYVGKFAGKYDLVVDPMFPEDEIIVGYKGANAMDAGFFYCPYIPVQPLDTVVDPETFQPRKGILTRYGKVAVQPASRFYRVIRLVGTGADYLTPEIFRNVKADGTAFAEPGLYDTKGPIN